MGFINYNSLRRPTADNIWTPISYQATRRVTILNINVHETDSWCFVLSAVAFETFP